MTGSEPAVVNRPKADGFPLAPIVEAIFGIQLAEKLSDDEMKHAAEALRPLYHNLSEMPFREFLFNAADTSVDVQPSRKMYRLEGSDPAEITLVRPEGIFVSQLAPYKSWDILFARMQRDVKAVEALFANKTIVRIACRYINRIDVPIQGTEAKFEDYLTVYIRLPETIGSIGPYNLQFQYLVPEISSLAAVQSGIYAQDIEGKISFVLDIDLGREVGIAINDPAVFKMFSEFKDVKNRLYKQFLTPKALEEFV
jgi:uncharacterized protein (TIGR04255 family)